MLHSSEAREGPTGRAHVEPRGRFSLFSQCAMHIASFRLIKSWGESKQNGLIQFTEFPPFLLTIVTIQQIHHIKSRSDLSFYWVWPNIIDLQFDAEILTLNGTMPWIQKGFPNIEPHQNLQISPSTTCLDCIKGKSSRLSRGLAASLRGFPHLPHLGWWKGPIWKLPWSVVQLSCLLVVMHWGFCICLQSCQGQTGCMDQS